jgi:hypothetical protein
MTKHYLQSGAILFAMMLVAGCTTTPISIDPSVEGAVLLPQRYDSVWYRSTLDKPGMAVMSDTGTLTVGNSSIEFAGGKERKLIALAEVHRLSFKKLGSDLINNWIVIEYGARESPTYAVLSTGSALGWSGGSDRIFSTIEYVIKKNRLASVEINR